MQSIQCVTVQALKWNKPLSECKFNNWTIINILSWLIWKDPDAGKDWWQKKGATEDEMVGWHHWLNGYGFGWTLGVGDGQGSLVCCGSWGYKELDMAEQLNWTELSPYAVLSWPTHTTTNFYKSNYHQLYHSWFPCLNYIIYTYLYI